jgi:hypothetical protein
MKHISKIKRIDKKHETNWFHTLCKIMDMKTRHSIRKSLYDDGKLNSLYHELRDEIKFALSQENKRI